MRAHLARRGSPTIIGDDLTLKTRTSHVLSNASVSITPRPTPHHLVQHLRRVETHALSKGRASFMCMMVLCAYAWTCGGLPAPPGLRLNSHVRSDDPTSQAWPAKGILYLAMTRTRHEEAISPRREKERERGRGRLGRTVRRKGEQAENRGAGAGGQGAPQG